MSLNFSVSDPSKRIMATERETTGNSKSPNKSSALSTPKTGPTTIPTINNGKIAGKSMMLPHPA